MEESATSTIVTAINNGSFWANIPAAAYVLLGVVISGIFTLIQAGMNNEANKQTKNLENKNSIELKDLENKHARNLKELEMEGNEKLQIQNQKAQKALRLLEDKLKAFSDFYICYSEVLLSGTSEKRHERIESLRKSTYKVRLLSHSLRTELDDLAGMLNRYANFYFAIVNNTKTYSQEEMEKKEKEHLASITPKILEIFDKLAGEM